MNNFDTAPNVSPVFTNFDPKPFALVTALETAKTAHREAFAKAAEHDGIDASAMFVSFSQGNPYTAEVDRTALAVTDAHAALQAYQNEIGVRRFSVAVISGTRYDRYQKTLIA